MSANSPVPDQFDPPPYTPPASGMNNNYGFPSGYFVIKSVATGRLLDVELDKVDDGGKIILWPEKETSLVEALRNPEADNQVFFIDDTGALCSRLSGHAIDVQDGVLVQRHRRPMSYPYPNPYSHPLPHFWYSSSTRQILVRFECDPSYPAAAPNTAPSNAWRKNSYVLASVPQRKPRTFLDDASEAFGAVIANPLSPFSFFGGGSGSGGPSKTGSSTVEEVHASDIDLREEELMEEDRGAEEEDDDSPDLARKVCAVMIREGEHLTEATKQRRTWQVVPLRWTRATNTSPSRSRFIQQT